MKYSFYTLGCKANQFDTQAMEQMISLRGHTIVNFDDEWDVCIINTCTVTSTSDKKSRQIIRQAHRRNPKGVIAVCGCYAQMSGNDLPDIDVLGGSTEKNEFLDNIEASFASKKKLTSHHILNRDTPFEVLDAGGLSGRTRALMKVQDGCDNYCTYCIIPYSRGHVRSMPIETAINQIIDLKNSGYHEVVVTGIEISSYGLDFKNNTGLIDLLEAMSHAAGEMRIRLGSLEPRTVTREFCTRLLRLSNVCRHFHLSLQSGCDAILSKMKRKYDTARYYESISLLREFFPDAAITTDLIVGFPEETDEDFNNTLEFIKKCKFSAMHIFPYSIRKGTPAAKMCQINSAVKDKRCAMAQHIAAEMHCEFLDFQIGKTYKTLFETEKNGVWFGHTDNYMDIKVRSDVILHNTLADVIITARTDNVLEGVLNP